MATELTLISVESWLRAAKGRGLMLMLKHKVRLTLNFSNIDLKGDL